MAKGKGDGELLFLLIAAAAVGLAVVAAVCVGAALFAAGGLYGAAAGVRNYFAAAARHIAMERPDA